MKTPRIFTLLIALCILAASTAPASAKSKSRYRGRFVPKPIKIHAGVDYTIEKVTGLSITVKNSKVRQTFNIEDQTQILIAHRKARASELQNGQKVIIRASTLDPRAARTIQVDDPAVPLKSSNPAAKSSSSKKPSSSKKSSGAKK